MKGYMFLGCLFFFLSPFSAHAEIEWSLTKEISFDKAPLDLASSSDGLWVYLLCEGEIEVISTFDNKVVKRIPIEKKYDKLLYSAQSSSLLVSSASAKSMRIIRLETINQFRFDGLSIKGPIDAPVTITVFSDYQCPFCKSLFPLIDQVMEKYPKDVRLIVKNFPLPSHKFAQSAALASLAAQQQGKFWEFHDKLYENMKELDDAKVAEIATDLKLDLKKFEEDRTSARLQDIINRDIVEGNAAQVSGTPTVFVNGKTLGNQSMPGFQVAISEALKKNSDTYPK